MMRPLRHFGFGCLAVALSAQAPAGVQFDVAINSNGAHNKLAHRSVRSLFLLRAQFWASGEAVMIILQPNDAQLSAAFCASVLEGPCSVVEEAELEKRYQGSLFARVVRATSAAEAAKMMQQNPTAIGYFRRGAAPSGTRVVYQP